jgi:hypothetical protein
LSASNGPFTTAAAAIADPGGDDPMTIIARSRARALTAGVALMALSMGGAFAALTPTVAQADDAFEDDGDDLEGDDDFEDDGDDLGGPPPEAEELELEILETALYAHPATDVLPPTLVGSGVPPNAVCAVQPEFCPDAREPISDAVMGATGTVQDEMEVSPVQPIPPDTLAASYLGGHERYESAMKFDLPPVPDGEEVTSFRVSLPMEQPSYDMNSPMFQDFFLAAFEFIGEQDPGILAERLPEVLQEDPIEIDSDVVGMEACPLLEPFEPEGAPQAAHADEIPRDEETGEPLIDCVVGSGASFDEETERWSFDLTFAAEAWSSGELENHGVLIRPTGGPNLAFGDPDTSTNAQVVLGTDDVTVAMDSAEPPPPAEPLGDEAGLPPAEDDFDDQAADGMAFEEDDGGFDDAGGDAGAGMGEAPDVDGPEVADGEMGAPEEGGPVDEPAVASPQLDEATPAGGPVDAPWWIWLLVPAFAGGAYLVTNALTAPVTAGAPVTAERGGAMSRLVSRGSGGPLNPA